MREILLLALHDLRLTLRDRMALVWMLAFPLAMMWIFGQVGGGRSGPPKLAIVVVDRDGGWLARALVEELHGDKIDVSEIRASEFASVRGTKRTLTIPEGFTREVFLGHAQTLRLETASGSNAEFDLGARAHVMRVIARTLGRLVEMDEGASSSASGTSSSPGSTSGSNPAKAPGAATAPRPDPFDPPEAAGEKFRALAQRPQLVTLEVSTAGKGRQVPSGFAQSVPGVLAMTVLMMTIIYGGVFLATEKRDGILKRQSMLPITRGQLFMGKLAGRTAISATQVLVLLAAGRLLFRMSWGGSPAGLILVLGAYAFAIAGLSTLVGALVSTPEQASGYGWVLSMMLAGLGGCWWPSEVMPRWLWGAAHVMPTPWAMDALHALISFGRGFADVLVPSAALAGFGLLFAALGARFLKYE